MTTTHDEATIRDQLIAEAAKVAEHGRSERVLPPEEARGLLELYYRHVPVEDLQERDPVDVYGAAVSHYRHAASRPRGSAYVAVFTPTVEEHGWACSHTVVEVITDDMPFLVDSVTMELSRENRGIHLVVHPQVVVRRDGEGRLLGLVDDAATGGGAPEGVGVGAGLPSAAADGSTGADGGARAAGIDGATSADGATGADGAGGVETVRESWIHVEIDREVDPAAVEEISTRLHQVLNNVTDAVQDWPRMREIARSIVDSIPSEPHGLSQDEVEEATELLRWLADDHFTFLGYREYALEDTEDGDVLRALPETGLGILRRAKSTARSFGQLPPAVRDRAREPRLLVLAKANSRSTVHRPAYLDYIGFKTFDDHGRVTGERRFLGLFTSVAYTESVQRIPVLRRKAEEVLERSGFAANSHSGKALLEIVENYPRDELFQMSVDELYPIVSSILHLQERRQLRLFVRRDNYGRAVSCLVYLPRERFATSVRLRIQDILMEAYGGAHLDWTLRFSESVLARLHFVVRVPKSETVPDIDVRELEQRLANAIRSWDDDFAEAVVEQVGEERSALLLRRYSGAFPEAYKEDFPARTAVADLRRIEELPPEGGLALSLYEPVDAVPGERRFKIYRTGSPLSLSHVLPRLSAMGVEVVDERPYLIEAANGVTAWIYDFGLIVPETDSSLAEHPSAAVSRVRELFQDAFAAVWSGRAESDRFNALVLRGGLDWRQAMLLRAYAKYLRQAGTTFSHDYLEDTLTSNVAITRLLVELFETRFDPTRYADSDERAAASKLIAEKIETALDDVASLDQDRIIRTFLTLIQTTLRTNYFQTDDQGQPKPYLACKLDPAGNPDLPEPRPAYEIWVYSPRVEGVHLRFGSVARGGLRWSDRREDFRTEVLGLVKAQMVKNTVIVPVGAKGGFFAKQLPDPASDREAWQAEGIACYRMFISGLLDITDNLVGGHTVPPTDVVRHDGDDSYLVVAADKGTATFSDIANEVAKSYGFWLGDAFASGGSEGYDHKEMGITALGAWESVKRHFREMGRDCQSEEFTCVGIGDMSGDVFGNGMLASEHIRLIAAFDHRHIFLDPDPDAATSYAERRRMFELPRSSWADYDVGTISAGGGVHPRTAKSIPITPQVRRALGIESGVSEMTPNELIRAILKAPVDLLWNGGIGTYVKASTESHADVGDKASDAMRVDGADLRCACVGEGGNLGFTQLGRIEYARERGGRMNTDFIDNSAGVDTSDREVNLKILLDGAVRDGDLTEKHRNQLLAEMTEDVGQLVLRDNYRQNLALSQAEYTGANLLHVHTDWIRRLEKAGRLDRQLEFLPTPRQLRERQAARQSLSAPELAVLLAYTKIVLAEELGNSDLPDDPYLRGELQSYFPEAVRERFADRIAEHPLRRELITTCVVNELVNSAGISFYARLSLETGASAAELTRAHVAARKIYGVDEVWSQIEALDNRIDAQVQTAMHLEGRTIAERVARWLVQNRRPPLDVAATVEQFSTGMRRFLDALPEVLRGRALASYEQRRDEYIRSGVEEPLAVRVAALSPAYAGLGIVETSERTGADPVEVARLHFTVGDRLDLGAFLERILALPRDDRWKTTARAALRDDLHTVHAALTANVLTTTDPHLDTDARVQSWEERDTDVVARSRSTLAEIVEGEEADLARLSVGLRVVRTLLPTSG